MNKQVLSREQINALITVELKKHDVCKGAYASAYWHQEDEGCNWDADILPSAGASSAMCEACDDLIQEALQALRAKYKFAEHG